MTSVTSTKGKQIFYFKFFPFPQSPEYPSRAFQIFSKIRGDIPSSRCTTGVIDNILFRHLWVVELTYCSIIFFKFNLRCRQFDIVPIICHRCHWHQWQIYRRWQWYCWQLATGIFDTSSTFGKFTNSAPWLAIFPWIFTKNCIDPKVIFRVLR